MEQERVERVIVSDDDEALLRLMVSHLQRRGYQVESAQDGLEAFETIRTNGPFAVLVTDLMMPSMSGLELLRESRKLDPWLEVIVITAAGTLESAISAMREDGAYDYLTKPLGMISELSLAVGRAAAHRRLQLERNMLQARVASDAERFRTLVTNTGDAVLSADEHGNLLVVNPVAARLIGKDDLAGSPALENLPPPLAKLITDWQKASGGRGSMVVELSWPNGSLHSVNLSPIQDAQGNSTGWMMVMHDVTHLQNSKKT